MPENQIDFLKRIVDLGEIFNFIATRHRSEEKCNKLQRETMLEISKGRDENDVVRVVRFDGEAKDLVSIFTKAEMKHAVDFYSRRRFSIKVDLKQEKWDEKFLRIRVLCTAWDAASLITSDPKFFNLEDRDLFISEINARLDLNHIG